MSAIFVCVCEGIGKVAQVKQEFQESGTGIGRASKKSCLSHDDEQSINGNMMSDRFRLRTALQTVTLFGDIVIPSSPHGLILYV